MTTTPTHWFRIVLPYCVGAIGVAQGRVVKTPPIFRWMIGKDGPTIRAWVARKGGTIDPLD